MEFHVLRVSRICSDWPIQNSSTRSSPPPICAVVPCVPLLDESQTDDIDSADTLPIPVAAELFATSLDIHLINGDIAADPQDLNTADNRPATQEAAMNRLAHVVCYDRDEISDVQLSFIARHIADQQVTQIASAVINRLQYVSDLVGSPRTPCRFCSAEAATGWQTERSQSAVLFHGSHQFS